MSDLRHILFFSGKRGGFNHMVPLLERIKADERLTASVAVSDMHLSSRFGNTVDEVRKYADEVHPVHTLMEGDSKVARAKSIGLGVLGMADLLDRVRPDIVVVLGDRGEILAPAICAAELNIPLAHLFGGDITQGGVDEVVRHAVTRLANLHFASNVESAERIVKMGEEPWRVHEVGSPVLDLVFQQRYTPAAEVRAKYAVTPEEPVALLLQHSVTWQVDEAGAQMRATLDALGRSPMRTIAVLPCADPGFEAVRAELEQFAAAHHWFSLHKNIEFPDFWGLMATASVLVGNSSCALYEAPSFGLPAVNVGIRQEGRLGGDNLLHAGHDPDDIELTIRRALTDEAFRARVALRRSPYGDGKAAERIVRVLAETELNETLLRKKLTF